MTTGSSSSREPHSPTVALAPAVQPLTGHRNQLAEGPVWSDGRLLHVDILGGQVHSIDPETGQTRSLPVPGEVSAVIPRSTAGLVLAVEHELVSYSRSGVSATLAIVEDDRPDNRFNDCRCDLSGRLWAGTMSRTREPGTAGLYCLEAGEPIRMVIAETTLSNGIGWSPDWTRMYFIDSTTQQIDMFDFDVAAGTLANRQVFATIDQRDGMPDGLAVDIEGGVWVCLFRGSSIHRYEPTGALSAVISLPVTDPTCPAFGGGDLRTLYITTARHRLSPEEQQAEPMAGMVLSFDAGVTGMPAQQFAG